MKHTLSLMWGLLGLVFALQAQEITVTLPDTPDSTDRPKNFSLVFNRGLMIAGPSPDSVPLNGTSSGTYFIGGGIRVSLWKDIVRLRITPGLAWTHLAYDQTNLKSFPTIQDSTPYDYAVEKHVLTYAELPVGVFVNLSKDEDGDTRYFVEAGGYFGYLISANYRTAYTDENGLRVKEKVRDLEQLDSEWNPFRYGVYARFGYRWASLYASWRLSDVMDEFTNAPFVPRGGEGYRNPNIPPMELGLTIFL
ncbi:MAG: outer membrane beta-barrel protein [Bacteroidota bacterium]